MSNFRDNKIKLIESLKRLDFSVVELLQNISLVKGITNLDEINLIQENFELRKKMEILLKENQNLKNANNECVNDVEFAIKIVENIIIRLKNENKS